MINLFFLLAALNSIVMVCCSQQTVQINILNGLHSHLIFSFTEVIFNGANIQHHDAFCTVPILLKPICVDLLIAC